MITIVSSAVAAPVKVIVAVACSPPARILYLVPIALVLAPLGAPTTTLPFLEAASAVGLTFVATSAIFYLLVRILIQ